MVVLPALVPIKTKSKRYPCLFMKKSILFQMALAFSLVEFVVAVISWFSYEPSGARLQQALLLEVSQPGGTDRAQPERLQPGHPLARVVMVLQGPDRQHRVERRHRGVRAGTDLEPAGYGGAEGVHGGRTVFPQPSFVHPTGVPPRGVEGRLDRDRHPQGRGPLHLPFRGHLEVLEAMPAGPEVAPPPGAQRAVHAFPHAQ
jgi:hypothetical protein